jgi:GNAT superfamily N-acetyltransferase
MKGLELKLNHPVDTRILSAMFGNREDLHLVWPYAHYPFDHSQWQEVLDHTEGNRSFLVYWDGKLAGHAALRVSDTPGTRHVSYLYLKKQFRSRGIGRRMLERLEAFARDRLNVRRLTLVVRSYNPPARQCYLNCGFKEYAQEDTLIRMAKDIDMIRRCTEQDTDAIYEIINDAARAYKGIIPEDRWHEPYMPLEVLKGEIEDGVKFCGFEDHGRLLGVMGIQDRGEVDLIRHAYVKTDQRRKGIGRQLLKFLESQTEKPILIGTWADAVWAVDFYCRNGYRLTDTEEKTRLLQRFWNIPGRQVETSVVLASEKWPKGY